MGYRYVTLAHEQGTIGDPALALLDELAQRLPRNDQMRFTCHARASLATTNLIGISRVIRSRLNICRGADGRVLPRPGDAIPPACCFTRRPLPPIYIRGTSLELLRQSLAVVDMRTLGQVMTSQRISLAPCLGDRARRRAACPRS